MPLEYYGAEITKSAPLHGAPTQTPFAKKEKRKKHKALSCYFELSIYYLLHTKQCSRKCHTG